MARRGWSEVVANEPSNSWEVYDWSESRDSGACISSHATEREAIIAALALAETNNRKCLLVLP